MARAQSSPAPSHRSAPRRRKAQGKSLIGEVVKRERMQLGITQIELALRLDVSLHVLRAIEQGEDTVTLSLLEKILACLGLQLLPKPILFAPEIDPTLPAPKKDEVMAALRRVLPILRTKFNVASLAIFGSVARDQARQDSDVDLLVSYTSRPSATRLKGDGDLYLYLRTVLPGREVDLVDVRDLKPKLRKYAEEDLIHVEES